MSTIIHLLGNTCAGKTTIITAMLEFEDVKAVQIGKTLRAKYGADYFKGQAAPAHTAVEAMQIYVNEVKAAIAAGFKLILVDGQPRDIKQAHEVMRLWPDQRVEYLMVHAEHDVRLERAKAGREPGPDLDLALARMDNDYRNSYSVMVELMLKNELEVNSVDTSHNFDLGYFCRDLWHQTNVDRMVRI